MGRNFLYMNTQNIIELMRIIIICKHCAKESDLFFLISTDSAVEINVFNKLNQVCSQREGFSHNLTCPTIRNKISLK